MPMIAGAWVRFGKYPSLTSVESPPPPLLLSSPLSSELHAASDVAMTPAATIAPRRRKRFRVR